MRTDRTTRLLRSPAGLLLTAVCLALAAGGCGDTIVQEVVRDAGGGATDAGVRAPLTRPCSDDAECDNGLFCDGEEVCTQGRCALGDPVDCSDGVDCTRDRCSDELGRCVYFGPDADGDGHAEATCLGADGEPMGDDCDDTDSNRFPGNIEFCDDGHDEDCDLSTVGARDMDRDGFTDVLCCNAAGGDRLCGEDCDDNSRGVNPATSEVCDGYDNDCDSEVDEGVLVVGYPDVDSDNHGDSQADAIESCSLVGLADDRVDCDDGNITIHGAQVEICDDIDNDCDDEVDEDAVAVTWYFDLDGDGFGNAQSGTKVSCEPVPGASLLPTDCDDSDKNIYPGAAEICDGRDNDCNGEADYLVGPGDGEDDDGDGRPDPACQRYPEDCNDDDPTVYPGALELCDGIDNDCNGLSDANVALAVWFKDEDGDGYGDDGDPGTISCEQQPGRVRVLGDCDDGDARRNPGVEDGCDGLRNVDDDCDGDVDEAEVAEPFYPDVDRDGFGNGDAEPFFACSAPDGYSSSPADCDDGNLETAPGASEMCAMRDDIDNDCDGDIDCEDRDCQDEASCAELFTLSLKHGPLAPGFVSKLTSAFTLVLKDQLGQLVEGQEITLTASEGALVVPDSATTDASGEVHVQARLGRKPGTYTFTARQADVTPFVFTLEALRPPTGQIYTEVNVGHVAASTPVHAFAPVAASVGPLYYPGSTVTASDGTTYVASRSNHRVFAVSPRGEQRVIAGTGRADTQYDGQPADVAELYNPEALALDEVRQRLYISQWSSGVHGRIRVVDLETGLIDTFAGGSTNNEPPYGDDASAKQAYLYNPRGLVVAADGTLYFADTGHNRIRAIDGLGIIRTVLQSHPCTATDRMRFHGCDSYSCNLQLTEDGGAFLAAGFCGTEMGYAGNYGYPGVAYIADITAPEPELLHVAGQYSGEASGTAQEVVLGRTGAIALDPAGNLYLADANAHRIRRIDGTTTLVSEVAGTGAYSAQAPPDGDYGPAVDAELYTPMGLEFTPSHDLRVVEQYNHAVRVVVGAGRVTPTATAMEVVSGQPEAVLAGALLGEPFGVRVSRPGDGSAIIDVPIRFSADQDSFYLPTTEGTTDIGGILAVSGRAGIVPGAYELHARMDDIRGNPLHEADLTVTVVEPDPGTISTIVNSEHVAGTRLGPATRSQLYYPWGLSVSADGSIYVADHYAHRVVRVTPEGLVELIAGGNGSGFNGDGGQAVEAQLSHPSSVVVDDERELLYITDRNNHAVRVVDLVSGTIDLFAGRGSQVDSPFGLDGPALDAVFAYPDNGRMGPDGALYFSDANHHRIVRIPLGTGAGARTVSLVAGTASGTAPGCQYQMPDDPLALRSCSNGCAFDWTSGGDMVIYGYLCGPETSGYNRYMVAVMDAETGELSAAAGHEYSNNGFGTMPLPDVQFNRPGGLVVDADDRVYVADYGRHVIRRFDPYDTDPIPKITTLVGTGQSGSGQPASQGEWGPAAQKILYQPIALAMDAEGRLLISAYGQHALYRVW